MSKSRPKTRWNLIVILILAFALTYSGYKYFFRPTPAPIFLIAPTSLEYGDTSLRGVLRKDVPAGQPGTYLLALPDGRPVRLNISDSDHLLGQPVTVSGYLTPAQGDNILSMTVSQIQVSK